MQSPSQVTTRLVLHVEDDDATAQLFRLSVKQKSAGIEVQRLSNGADIMPYLTRSGRFKDAALPDLVVLDLNLPKKSGLQALSEIRKHTGLKQLPVIVFSSSTNPQDQKRAVSCGANAYIAKPDDLQAFLYATEDIVSYLGDLTRETAVGDEAEERIQIANEAGTHGLAVARTTIEARSPAMLNNDPGVTQDGVGFYDCTESRRLLDSFGNTVQELLHLHDEQFRAILNNDQDCNRFDLLIHMANEKKQLAKYAYLRHLESHGCSNADHPINET
jgi:CheY-like chemotaxis protein